MKKYVLNALAVLFAFGMLTSYADRSGTADRGASVREEASHDLECGMPDISFDSEEYQKLQALKLDGYEDMSISEYQNKVWELTDTEEYGNLLERFSQSKKLYESKDSDETANFLFYILNPITAENWQVREFDGFAKTDYSNAVDNASIEFFFTLTIRDADALTVGEYNAARTGVTSGLQNVLRDRTKEELQDATLMQAEIDMEIHHLNKKWGSKKLKIAVEYMYTPLFLPEPNRHAQAVTPEPECRKYPNGTKEDYRSLFALKTPDYQNMSIADFNRTLLEWANENYERMERINCDMIYDDFAASLTDEQRRFVSLSVNFSGIENGKYVQSNYTGRAEEDPVYGQYLPQKKDEKNGRGARCDLYYQFSYHVADKEMLTVGERDDCLSGMMADIQEFWENADIDFLLGLEKMEVAEELQKIADLHSTEQLVIKIREDHVSYERMDERAID